MNGLRVSDRRSIGLPVLGSPCASSSRMPSFYTFRPTISLGLSASFPDDHDMLRQVSL